MLVANLSSLTLRVTGGIDGQGGGDGPLVVLMHGFGAMGDDLVPLASMMRVPREVRFVFPEAPHVLPPSMGGYGRMWWPIDVERLERAMQTGAPRDMRSEDPPGLVEARERVATMLDELRRVFAVPEGGLVLGGFSQGSMLACDLSLRTDVDVGGLVVLSGTMLVEDEWKAGMARRSGLPVFQSHGSHDMLLPFGIAEEMSRAFAAADMPTTWVPFRGGHDIPRPVLARLEAFLGSLVGA
jgi:phospholipase/carboxylesterase